jgi:hypothetical protein
MNRPLGFLLCLLLATVVGCSKGDQPTYANVKGTVMYNGKPVEKGKITFEILGRPPQTLDIVGGEFNGQAMVGENKVSVSAKKKTTNAPKLTGAAAKDAEAQIKGYTEKRPGSFGGPPVDYDPSMVEYIPPEWGTNSTQKRVIEAGQTNQFEISIKSKN